MTFWIGVLVGFGLGFFFTLLLVSLAVAARIGDEARRRPRGDEYTRF